MSKVLSAVRYAVHHDPRETLKRVFYKFIPERVTCLDQIARHVQGKRGLEIGGPTPLFENNRLVPVYPVVGALDNINFSGSTVWEGTIAEGTTFTFDQGKKCGGQFIREAGDLGDIKSDDYDFVLSSHVIEHLANPLGALKGWLRVLRPGGVLVLVVPHRDGTFDHRRPVTPLAHLISDLDRQTPEDDLTHLPEILELHDLKRDTAAGDHEQFRQRSIQNVSNRCLHHHVFDTQLVGEVLNYLKLQIIALEARNPYHIVAAATLPAIDAIVDNLSFIGTNAAFRRSSPFVSDRNRS